MAHFCFVMKIRTVWHTSNPACASSRRSAARDAVQLWLRALGTTADREAAETGNCTWLRIAGSPPSASRGEMNANSASLAISTNLGII